MKIVSKDFPNHFLHWFKWLFLLNDSYPAITFLFVGRRNPTNVRFLSLYRETKTVRVVYMRGSRFKGIDRIYLILFEKLINVSYKKTSKYVWFDYLAVPNNIQKGNNGLLQIDDPEYTSEEVERITQWEKAHFRSGYRSVIVCTNDFTKKWLESFLYTTKVEIVEQGFVGTNDRLNPIKYTHFACVYSSPFIDYLNDKHENHKTWGAKILIEEIIPKLYEIDKGIEFHLIGNIGKNARRILESFPNVICHGLQSPEETMKILSKCHLGMYPRLIDNFRRVLKIYEYIGAELPIVAFELEDTRIVKEEDLGISVSDSDGFVDAILKLKNNRALYNQKLQKVKRAGLGRTWIEHSKKIDAIHVGSN